MIEFKKKYSKRKDTNSSPSSSSEFGFETDSKIE
jgi:hypothetical protein